MSAHKKFQLKAQNWWLAVDPYMTPRRSGMHKYKFLLYVHIRLALKNLIIHMH